MPYDSLEALPDAVKGLPRHGQEIWQAAFNAAFEEYGGDEAKAAATAWAAVKQQYEQDADGEWTEKREKDQDDTVTVTSTLLERFAAAVDYVRHVLERLFIEPADQPAPASHPVLKAGHMVVTRDAATGRRRWLGIPTNALYPDAMGEGLSSQALQEAVGRMMASGTPQTETQEKLVTYVYPDRRVILDMAHFEFPISPGVGMPLAVGTADCVAMCGPFVIATGLEDSTPAGKAFFDYVEAHPEEDLRMSHLFETRDGDRGEDGVYQRVDLVRFTVAPASVVANEWTVFALADARMTGGEQMKIDEGLRPFFVGVFGEEQVKTFEEGMDAYLARAQAAGVEARTAPPAAELSSVEDPRLAEMQAQFAALAQRVEAQDAALAELRAQQATAGEKTVALARAVQELATPAGVTTPPAEPIPVPGPAPVAKPKSILDDPRFTFRAG